MEIQIAATTAVLGVLATPVLLPAQPVIDSWFTANSGRYARIHTTDASKAAGNVTSTATNAQSTLPAAVGDGFFRVTRTSLAPYDPLVTP